LGDPKRYVREKWLRVRDSISKGSKFLNLPSELDI
jgi:hypothetical protein